MSKLFSPGSGRSAIQVLAVCAGAAALSGCSADATRFESPFSNPFAANTTAKPQHVASARPVGAVRTTPVVAQALPARPATVAAAPAVSRETTGSIQPGPRTVPGASFGNWTAAGGTAVTVAQGDTAEAMSKRYGVPQPILLQVNGLKSPGDLQPGVRITIPIYNATAAAAAPPPARSVAAVEAQPARVAIAAAAPPHSLALPKTRVAVAAPPAAASKVVAVKAASTSVAAGSGKPAKVAAAAKPAAGEPATKGKAAVVAAAPAAAPAKTAPQRTAASPPPAAKVEHVASAAPAKAVDQTPTATVQATESAAEAAGPEFRWPARGRIIQGFKGGAGGNDGINIAVPEGTAVKAAEGGTVIYAGNEMKAYGSMVLIRHPNGFISAYANNGEIDVKKGEAVKRGQVIAKSGQTGNVSSPQLHFELRKGRDPVDPTQFLAGL